MVRKVGNGAFTPSFGALLIAMSRQPCGSLFMQPRAEKVNDDRVWTPSKADV